VAQYIYKFLAERLPALTRPVVLEIGAHLGTDTQHIIPLLRPPYVYVCFEPDSRNVAALRELQAGGLDFILAPFAVGNMDLRQPFYLSNGRGPGMAREFTDGSSLLEPTGNNRPWIRWATTTVVVHRLDTACQAMGITHVDFIWCDVQGAERLVIEGGWQTLLNTRWLYAECVETERHYEGQPTLKQLEAALPEPADWRIVYRDGTDVLFEHRGEIQPQDNPTPARVLHGARHLS